MAEISSLDEEGVSIIELKEGYVEKAYRRIWDNFAFSFKIYACNRLYQARLCLESIEELEQLYNRFLVNDNVVTRGFYNHYRKLIMINYDRVR